MTYMKPRFIAWSAAALFLMTTAAGFAGTDEFDLTGITIPVEEFVSGGPGKDDIPAISAPEFGHVATPYFLDDELVIGLVVGSDARAYPLRVLNWHEIVNDIVGGRYVAVTWCPLTRSAIAFDRKVDGNPLEFGVSGLLYNSNLVMYDRDSGGLWPQLALEAASGKYGSKTLTMIPSVVTTWKEWKGAYPGTKLMSYNTGHEREYFIDPYLSYHNTDEILFHLAHKDPRLSPKEMVIGVRVDGEAKAYPMRVIGGRERPLEDRIAGRKVLVHGAGSDNAYITDEGGDVLPAAAMYWFAWSAFNKDTSVYSE